jgi:hypothetical protein
MVPHAVDGGSRGKVPYLYQGTKVDSSSPVAFGVRPFFLEIPRHSHFSRQPSHVLSVSCIAVCLARDRLPEFLYRQVPTLPSSYRLLLRRSRLLRGFESLAALHGGTGSDQNVISAVKLETDSSLVLAPNGL